MSWLDRTIVNRDNSLIQEQVETEEAKKYREVREDTTTFDEVTKQGKSNIVPIGSERFICPGCETGWTFSRMKTIECCGYTYVRT